MDKTWFEKASSFNPPSLPHPVPVMVVHVRSVDGVSSTAAVARCRVHGRCQVNMNVWCGELDGVRWTHHVIAQHQHPTAKKKKRKKERHNSGSQSASHTLLDHWRRRMADRSRTLPHPVLTVSSYFMILTSTRCRGWRLGGFFTSKANSSCFIALATRTECIFYYCSGNVMAAEGISHSELFSLLKCSHSGLLPLVEWWIANEPNWLRFGKKRELKLHANVNFFFSFNN